MDDSRNYRLRTAVEEVKSHRLSYRKASKLYNIPIATICDRLKGRTVFGKKQGKSQHLSVEDEEELSEYISKRSSLRLGLSKKTFLRYVGSFAKARGVPFKNDTPSEKWWTLYKKRHSDLSLRKPEPTSAVRHIAMTKNRIDKYFDTLTTVIETNSLEPSSIWNMDECGIQLSHRPNKVLARKSEKALHFKVSSNKETITLIACGNAAGTYVPPHIIVPGKTFNATKSYDTENAPPGTKLSVSDSGWTKQGIAEMWFKENFLPNIDVSRPQLLVLDGHDSHGHIALLELARENNIILIELPSHTSNWTQPFDRTVFRPFKTKWFEACDQFITLTGLDVKKAQFFRLFKKAWEAMTPEVIKSGFRACGIVPLNRNAIPQEAYQPGTVYKPANNELEVVVNSEQKDTAGHCKAKHNDEASMEVENRINEAEPLAVEETSENRSNNLSFELSLTSEEELMNLSGLMDIIVGPDGDGTAKDKDIVSLNETPEDTDSLALRVLEENMTAEQHARFLAAELAGKEIVDDPMYFTWKRYRTATNVGVEQLFPIPTVPLSARKRKQKPGSGYFILTCDAAYEEKRRAEEEKKKKEKAKKERQMKLKKEKLSCE